MAHDASECTSFTAHRYNLALAGGMLGDVRQPQPVRPVGGEVAPHPVIVDRRAGLGVLAPASALAERAPPAVVPADPPGGPFGHRLISGMASSRKEAVAELGVVAVSVEQGVGSVCLRRARCR